MKHSHIIRAILYLGIAAVFATATFYKIPASISIPWEWASVFEPQWQNWALSGLFALLGILEIREVKK